MKHEKQTRSIRIYMDNYEDDLTEDTRGQVLNTPGNKIPVKSIRYSTMVGEKTFHNQQESREEHWRQHKPRQRNKTGS